MEKGVIIGIIAAVVIVVAIFGFSYMNNSVPSTQSNTQSAASANVVPREGLVEASIDNFAFNPSEIKIKVGTKVTWTNNDNTIHRIVSDSGEKSEFSDSKTLAQGESYGHTFTQAGVYNYHCAIHPYMKGKVVVE